MAENIRFLYHQISICTTQDLLKTQDILKSVIRTTYLILKSQIFNDDENLRQNDWLNYTKDPVQYHQYLKWKKKTRALKWQTDWLWIIYGTIRDCDTKMFNILEVHAVLKNFLQTNVCIFVLRYYSIQSRHRIAVCTRPCKNWKRKSAKVQQWQCRLCFFPVSL